MWKWIKKGFVSVELVILAVIILTSGVAGIVTMGDKGSQAMKEGMDKLASLGIFGGEVVSPGLNSDWYHPSLNIKEGDVSPTSDFVFVLNPDGTTYTITDYTNVTDKTVVIPRLHDDGKTITGIGDSAFQAMGLTSIALHNAINSIGDYAFEGNELEVLYFSDYTVANMPRRGMIYTSSVSGPSNPGLHIGQYAFANNKLTKVELINGMTSIGVAVFKNNNLTTIALPAGISTVSIEAFMNNDLASVSLPETLTSIGASAFKDNELISVNLPESISSLGAYSFQNNRLESLIVPSGVTNLGASTFKGNSLTSVVFKGARPLTLGLDVFAENPTLPDASIVVSAYQFNNYRSSAQKMGVTEVKFVIDPDDANHEGDFVFTWNSTLNGWSITSYVNSTDKDVVIPDTRSDGLPIVQIGDSAFSGKALTSVVLPSALRSVGVSAFYSNQLSSLTIPSSVTNLYAGSFGNNKLTSVTFLGKRPAVSDLFTNNTRRRVFDYNSLLGTNSIKVPSAYLASYRHSDFTYPAGLAADCVTISPDDANLEDGFGYRWDSVNNGWEIFENVNKTNKDIVIPQSRLDGKPVVSIGANTFTRGGLTSLVLPEGLKEVKSCAFCINSIVDLKLPSTLVKIGSGAFSSNKITALNIPSGLAIIDENVFAANMITNLVLPEGVTTIKESAFNSSQIKTLVVPSTVTLIEAYAFSDNKLESIIFMGARPAGTSVTTTGTTYAFTNNPTLLDGSVKVKSQYLTSYRTNNLGIPASKFSIMPGDENIEGGLGYIWNGALNGWEVTEHLDKTVESIEIPAARLDGKPIVSISDNTFKSAGLTSLTLNEGLKEIGSSAFTGNAITSLIIPHGVTDVNSNAFSNNLISSLELPDTLLSIEGNAFKGNKLQSISIPASVTYIGGGAFRSNLLKNVVMSGPVPTTTSYTEYSPVYLQVYPFTQNPGLTEGTIYVPSHLYTGYKSSSFGVPSSSFRINPSDANLEGGLAYRWTSSYGGGWEVFLYADTTVKDVVIPDARLDGKPVVSIANSVFNGANLTSVVLPSNLQNLGSAAFANNQLQSVEIPSTLTTINGSTFYRNKLTQLVLPSSITTIGNSAFSENLLTTLTIPSTVKTMGENVFKLNKLVRVDFLGNKPTYSTSYTYWFTSNPTLLANSVYVPLAYISGYRSSTSNTMGFGIDRIIADPADPNIEGGFGYRWTASYGGGWELFEYYDKSVKDIVIPTTRLDGAPIVSVYNSTFASANLTSVSLSDGLKNIGTNAFFGNQLQSLNLPGSLTTIGGSAFESNKLVDVTFNGLVTSFGSYSFRNNATLLTGSVRVPSVHLGKYQSAASGMSLTTSHFVGY